LALDAVKGRIVGSVKVPNIETVGHPRLMGNLDITDQEVNALIDGGKISHSTGFFGIVDSQNKVTSVTPNHVLVFKEDANNLPKDRGAFILNKQEIEMVNKDYSKEDMDAMLDFMKENPGMMDKGTMDKMYAAMDKANQKEYLKSVLNDLQSHPEMMDDDMKSMMKGMKNKETDMGKEDELAKQLEISNKEKETLKAELDTRDAKLKVFEQKETERIKETREAQWQTIKKSIPVGLTHKSEDEAKLRSEFEADPYGFAVKLTEFKQKQGTLEEGKEFANATLTDEQKEAKEAELAADELRDIRGIGRRGR